MPEKCYSQASLVGSPVPEGIRNRRHIKRYGWHDKTYLSQMGLEDCRSIRQHGSGGGESCEYAYRSNVFFPCSAQAVKSYTGTFLYHSHDRDVDYLEQQTGARWHE
jgi:hypothetical protein